MPVLMLSTDEWYYLVAMGVYFPEGLQPWRVNKLLKHSRHRPYYCIGITSEELAHLEKFMTARPKIPSEGNLRHKIALAIQHNPKQSKQVAGA